MQGHSSDCLGVLRRPDFCRGYLPCVIRAWRLPGGPLDVLKVTNRSKRRKRDARGHFPAGTLLITLVWFALEWEDFGKFDTVTQVAETNVSKGSAMPTSQNGTWPYTFPNFLCPYCAETVWPRATKYGIITRMGRSAFPGGQPPHSKGRGRSFPKHFGPATCAHTVWETTTNFLW